MAAIRYNFSGLVRLYSLCLAIGILLIAQQSNAKTLDVGGALGWTDFDTAISAAPNYEKWSSSHNINVGDVLVFSFPAGFQNVYLMPTKSAHDSCDFSEAIELDAGNAGTYGWRATKEGTYYFSSNKLVEGLGTHCEAAQKLAITVTAATKTISTTTTTSSSALKELKPKRTYLEQRLFFAARSMIESLATAPAVAPVVSPLAPVPVGAPVPVVAPPVTAPVAAPAVLTPTPTPTSSPLSSPPAPPTGPAPAPASPPGHNAGVKVSTQAWAGIFTAMLALLALCL